MVSPGPRPQKRGMANFRMDLQVLRESVDLLDIGIIFGTSPAAAGQPLSPGKRSEMAEVI